MTTQIIHITIHFDNACLINTALMTIIMIKAIAVNVAIKGLNINPTITIAIAVSTIKM